MPKVGLDIHPPVDPESGQINPIVNPDLAGKSALVRVHFMLGPWDSPDDAGWRATYDEVIDGYLGQDIQVYGTVGPEMVKTPVGVLFQDDGPDAESSDAAAWLETYVRNFAAIAAHFQGRVHWFESLSQPNRLHQGRPWISPYWFAKLLGAVYRAVKLEQDDSDAGMLITGPLFAHNNNDVENATSIGWRYLQQVFQAGKESHGWEDIRAATGSYPLDGIGYNLYVDQGPDKDADAIAGTLRHYLDSIFRVWVREDDQAAQKKIYVSEFGWQSHIGEERQADNLSVAFDVLRNDPRIGAAIWFTAQDFPDEGQPEGWNRFGLFRETGLDSDNAKPAYTVLQDVAASDQAGELDFPLADGFAFPLRRPGRDVLDDFKIDTFFADPHYHQQWGAWHPGEDWNGKTGGDTDLGEPVFAISHGRVVDSDFYRPGWGNVTLIEHRLPDGRVVWSQYAHMEDRRVATGEVVARGQHIGGIGKGADNRWVAHLHFEIRKKNLPANQWFDLVRHRDQVVANYENPRVFIQSHLALDYPHQPSRVGFEIVVDNDNSDRGAGRFRKARVDSWWSAPFGFRGSTLWTFAVAERLENWAEWRPNLPEAGRYDMLVFVPRSHATTRSARYEVNHRDGRTEATVDQSRYFDEWVSLGAYDFDAGTAGYLRLTDVTGEDWSLRRRVAFDAAKWVRVADE